MQRLLLQSHWLVFVKILLFSKMSPNQGGPPENEPPGDLSRSWERNGPQEAGGGAVAPRSHLAGGQKGRQGPEAFPEGLSPRTFPRPSAGGGRTTRGWAASDAASPKRERTGSRGDEAALVATAGIHRLLKGESGKGDRIPKPLKGTFKSL